VSGVARLPEQFASTPGVRRRMQAIRAVDTKPELAVRRAVHALVLRYRVHTRPLPDLNRRADLVFTRARVAVFVDGCFWHGCPEHGRRQFGVNGWYWPDKIDRNVRRDAETTRLLTEAGWRVVRAWEHEDAATVAATVADTVRAARGP
jgi:DNA mismatch endonuclease, patch repair protein